MVPQIFESNPFHVFIWKITLFFFYINIIYHFRSREGKVWEPSKRRYIIRGRSSTKGLAFFGEAIFEISRELREKKRCNRRAASFLFSDLGWEKVEEETWRLRVPMEEYCHWTSNHLILRIAIFFSQVLIWSSVFHCPCSFWSDHLRAYNGILFICCRLVLLLIVLRIF